MSGRMRWSAYFNAAGTVCMLLRWKACMLKNEWFCFACFFFAVAESMFDDIWGGEQDLQLTPKLSCITAPTQVIWGRYDRVSLFLEALIV